jgi:hypothetical protein
MFSARLIRHLFRQDRATIYLEGIALGEIAVAAPARRRSLFGRA